MFKNPLSETLPKRSLPSPAQKTKDLIQLLIQNRYVSGDPQFPQIFFVRFRTFKYIHFLIKSLINPFIY